MGGLSGRAVAAHGGRSGVDLPERVSLDGKVQAGGSQRAERRTVGPHEHRRPGRRAGAAPGARAVRARGLDHRGQRRRCLRGEVIAQRDEDPAFQPLRAERLDEQPDRPATRETHGKGLVVGVAEGRESWSPRCQHLERVGDHRRLHTPPGHRPGDLAFLAHGHRGSRLAGSRTLDADDPGQRHSPTSRPPPVDVVEDRPHLTERRVPAPRCHARRRLAPVARLGRRPVEGRSREPGRDRSTPGHGAGPSSGVSGTRGSWLREGLSGLPSISR